MKKIISLIIICSLSACGNKTAKSESDQNTDTTHSALLNQREHSIKLDTLNVSQFAALFKESELSRYDKNLIKRFEEYLQHSSEFWNTKCLMINDTLKMLEIEGYPLSLRAFKGELMRITTINESEAQIVIRTWILDRDYNVTDVYQLAGYGGDVDVSEHVYGEFINDTVYCYIDKTYQYRGNDNGEVDSTIQVMSGCLIFTDKGKIRRVETCR